MLFFTLFLKKGERKREEEKEKKDTGVIAGPLFTVIKTAHELMHVCWLEHSMMLEKPIPSTGIPPAVIQKKKKKKMKGPF